MTNDGKILDDINLTDEQLEKIKPILEQEKIKTKVIEKPKPNRKEYDFTKVNLKSFSKKHLIKIIYGLQAELNQYKEVFNNAS
ncbi:hypothetical protein [Amedibacillus dolichus]|uniref:Uncharacterized protein n=1 Tax=Amedibacillus dolichus DSM 3991 TaxID=428127 RepID=A8RC09_9FIRM|nr:hypothetical protein [Amedibacillus dolichus]EDP11315.1 hypothetical protein EUBDOL_01235 [Amedibacillus dolichus DSM 3991]